MTAEGIRAAVFVYLAAVNLALLAAMGADKRAAVRRRRRVSEASLFALAVLGGAAGGICGMLLFRHKTKKPAFQLGFPLILLVQLALAWALGAR